MKFTVEREKWARGGSSRLLDGAGMMCCLGFLAKACGAADRVIRDEGHPEAVGIEVAWPDGIVTSFDDPEDPEVTLYTNTRLTDEIIDVNDLLGYPDDKREARLTALFARIGVEVEFR